MRSLPKKLIPYSYLSVQDNFDNTCLSTVDLQVYMDDLTDTDEAIGKVKVAVLVPTCGEKTSVMLKALFGNLQLR